VAETVTAQVAVSPPSSDVAVITALPRLTGLTAPEELTVATAALEEDQLTLVLLALEGLKLTVRETGAPPFVRLRLDELRLIPVRATVALGVALSVALGLVSESGTDCGQALSKNNAMATAPKNPRFTHFFLSERDMNYPLFIPPRGGLLNGKFQRRALALK
jgi:hypothetical protein